MSKEIKSKAQEIVKQVAVIEKARKEYDRSPVMRNGIIYLGAIAGLITSISELAALTVSYLQEAVKGMRKSRIKDNMKALGYPQ